MNFSTLRMFSAGYLHQQKQLEIIFSEIVSVQAVKNSLCFSLSFSIQTQHTDRINQREYAKYPAVIHVIYTLKHIYTNSSVAHRHNTFIRN